MAAFLTRALGLTSMKPPPSVGYLTVVFVAVHQGDAALYQGACGDVGLIDTNRFRSVEVLDVIDELGPRALEWVAISHYDADHLWGVCSAWSTHPVSASGPFTTGVAEPTRRTPRPTPTITNTSHWRQLLAVYRSRRSHPHSLRGLELLRLGCMAIR